MQPTQNTATLAKTASRRWDGEPETAADRRFFDLRESGYTGPVDQDGYPALDPSTCHVTALECVSRTLRDAATYLAKYGWIRGCYYDPTSTVFTPGACVVGAIGMVCYGGPADAPAYQLDEPGFDDFDEATRYLGGYLQANRLDEFGDLYTYNDAKGRTADEVIAVLRQAADAWDRAAVYTADFSINTAEDILALLTAPANPWNRTCGGAA